MSTPLDSFVGELHIVAGARQSTTPATGVFTAPRRAARGRAEDTLYVLIDLNGDAASSTLTELKRRITDQYWATPGSVTAALRAAIYAGGEWLMDRNMTAPVPDRQTGGVTCAVLRGAEVFVAQSGPSSAYVTQRGSIEPYHAHDAEPLTPIGMARSSEVRFAHAELQPGDGLLLTDARAAASAPIESIASAIVGVGIDQALKNLAHVAGSGDLIALVVEATAAEVSAPVKEQVPAPTPAAPAVERAPSLPAPIIRTAPPTPKPERAVRAAPGVSAPPKESRATTTRVWLNALIQSVRRGAGSVGTAGQALVQRTLPEPAAVQRRAKQSGSGNTPLLAGIAIGIPILMSLLVVTIFIQQSNQAEVETLLIGAQNEITLAGQASGPEARAHWQAAIEQTNQALLLAPDSVAAAQRLAAAQAALDRIDNVVHLKPIQLYDFKSLGRHRLALQGFSLFVLDRAANQIDRLTLNSAGDGIEGTAPEHVYAAGTSVDGKVPGNLLDIVWMNSSEKRQTSSLIVLHQAGLLEYNLTFGLKSINFGTNTVPANARRLRSFIGNLYLLDPTATQVWRYAPKGDGYSDPPEAYFEQPAPEAAKAIDMAIDGSIYLLGSDGRITKYLGGQPDTFVIEGLGEPLRQPAISAVDTNVEASSLYVYDQASSRIVQFRPDGKVVRQFRADGGAFDAVEDVLIDEQSSRLFVISRGVLYTAQMPPVQ